MSTESDAARLQEFFSLFGNESDRQSPEHNRIHLARMHGLAVSGGNLSYRLLLSIFGNFTNQVFEGLPYAASAGVYF